MPLIDDIIALEDQRMRRNQGIRARGLKPGVFESQPSNRNLLVNTLIGNFRREQNQGKLERTLGDLAVTKERQAIGDPRSTGRLAETLTGGQVRREDASGSPGLIEAILPVLLGQQTEGIKARGASSVQAAKGQSALNVAGLEIGGRRDVQTAKGKSALAVQELENRGDIGKALATMIALLSSGGKLDPELLKLLERFSGGTRQSPGKKKNIKKKLVDPKRDLVEELEGLIN